MVLAYYRVSHPSHINDLLKISHRDSYSVRTLTYETDILPALSGLARAFQTSSDANPHGSNDYLAGIWRDDFAKGLLWIHGEFNGVWPHKNITKSYVAPTWSWASLHGRVRFPDWKARQADSRADEFTPLLIDTKILSAAGDEMGALITAELTFMAHLLQVVVEVRERRLDYDTFIGSNKYVVHTGIAIASCAFDANHKEALDNLYLMQVQVQRTVNPKERISTPTALLLQRCETTPHHYRRVGCARLTVNHEDCFAHSESESITLI